MFPDYDEPVGLAIGPSNGIDSTRPARAAPATPHNRGGSHSGSASAYGDA